MARFIASRWIIQSSITLVFVVLFLSNWKFSRLISDTVYKLISEKNTLDVWANGLQLEVYVSERCNTNKCSLKFIKITVIIT